MRDVKLILELLNQMNASADGSVSEVPVTFAMSDDNRAKKHNLDLLQDLGLASSENHRIRITDRGYAYLKEVTANKITAEQLEDEIEKGSSLTNAPSAIIKRRSRKRK